MQMEQQQLEAFVNQPQNQSYQNQQLFTGLK